MSPANNIEVVVIDASILVSICSKEKPSYRAARTALDAYTIGGAEFFAPSLVVGEVVFALCQKVRAGVLTAFEHANAVDLFLDIMKNISLREGNASLVKRAIEILGSYGCSRSSDSFYLALAEDLADNKTVELLTLDNGMMNQASKNALAITIKVP